MDGLRRFGARRRRKRRVHLRYPQQVHRLRSAGIRVLRGRFEEFLGPYVVLMWLHLAHSGLCGAALLGNCFVELVDNAWAIRRDDRDMTDLTVPPLGRIRQRLDQLPESVFDQPLLLRPRHDRARSWINV